MKTPIDLAALHANPKVDVEEVVVEKSEQFNKLVNYMSENIGVGGLSFVQKGHLRK